jgi:hypothetical protein
MRRVIIESPYAGDTERNIEYAKRCVLDSLSRGEAPIASHLLFPQPGVLLDDDPAQRAQGVAAGHAWIPVAHLVAVYIDQGISHGMNDGIREADRHGVRVEYRTLNKKMEWAA